MDDALPFFGAFTERIHKKLLTRITDVTGGRTAVVERSSEIPEVAAKLSQEMRSEYVLGCPNKKGRPRRRPQCLTTISVDRADRHRG
jgi:hypothetical protein